MAGNMRSRWVDFLTSDGDKPNRNRDNEFEAPPRTRAELLAMWNDGWKCVFEALAPLGEADLGRTVLIRNEPHSVMQAIQRQVAHYSYHIGQIVFLAKHFAGERWTSLSVPRGKSAEFTARVREGGSAESLSAAFSRRVPRICRSRGHGTRGQRFSPVAPRLLLESAVMGSLALLPLQPASRGIIERCAEARNRAASEGLSR